ncbi:MAG: protein-L-isoaspartate O-methyltransferase [Betaproteobacteria bacterium]|nr:protein-L-isoaspartate O-methyltransferase [Betaproteobacteria bacterium]
MDIERARFNMVEQQIRPWDVLDSDVLELLYSLKRENFVAPAYRSMAFTDMEIPLNLGDQRTGQSMFSPKMEARILQELGLQRNESVLEVGTGSGYMAALMAHRASQIVSLEIIPELARFAQENVARAGITNVRIECADGSQIGTAGATPGDVTSLQGWDAIVLSGSVPVMPQGILARLRNGGRAIAIVGEAPVMSARLFTRIDGGGSAVRYETVDLFETMATPLQHFPQLEAFRF